MPKIITARRRESEVDQAREYVKTHILLPSALVGMVFMVAAALSFLYQFLSDPFGWQTFVEMSGLLVVGIIAGWIQASYQRYLLREHPGFFAGRLKIFSRGALKRTKRDALTPTLEHSGRKWVPLFYLVGILVLVATSFVVSMYGRLYFVTAFFMPWVGFFWAKMFFWRSVLK